MIVIVMGVAGCGKTTIGELLAERLGCRFLDADAFHPPVNIAKMAAGKPLSDADRVPWLDKLNGELQSSYRKAESAVLACSALKQSHRERLARGIPELKTVYLRGDYATIEARLKARRGHYMKAGMLESQFAALEEPADALAIGIDASPEEIVGQIRNALVRRKA